ncbi:hypothetical protein OHQ89_16260 [Streptomyces canus]|uniref:hypothetical protein n=1 Tax=Streptomyces canus TaxID=58343 RepID=UPI0030E38F16
MTQTPSPQWGPRSESTNTPETKKRRTIFPWVFLVVQVIFIVWIILGINSAGDSNDCSGLTGDALKVCRDAGDAGTAIGVGLVIGLWAAVDIILGISYLVFRLGRRERS